MSVTQETLGRTRLSFADEAEIDEFVDVLARYERGELSPDQWRAFRLVRGTYGQRQDGDAQMLRIKIPQGILDGPQLHALADAAETYSRGFGHVTTRQNVQLHFLKLHDVEKVQRHLATAGLTTREACGSAVRNVTACPYAGVAHDEAFDVTPYAEALSRYFLRHPLSATLPRKFKVAFEGCPEDHALVSINDIGWQARLWEGRRGFRVTIGGGTAILCTSGGLLYDFLPAGEILAVMEAVLRVFRRLGDFKHKQRNRMKFLIRELGWDAWRAEYEAELLAVRAEGGPRLPFDPERPPVEAAPEWPAAPAPSVTDVAQRAAAAEVRGPGLVPQPPSGNYDYLRWVEWNLRPQRQKGYAVAVVRLRLGDLTGAQLRILADLAAAYGDGTVRTTHDQNLILRWVKVTDGRDLYDRLAAAGLGEAWAGSLADVTSCPGAEACRLAVTQSRGIGRLVGEHLQTRPELVQAARGLNIKVSGCPNGCGQHHVAGIGLQGSVRKLGDKVVPQYFVMVGGGSDDSGAHFARLAAKIPARRVPAAVERLAGLFAAEARPEESAASFFQRTDPARVRELLADLEALTVEDALPTDYVDPGEDHEFRVETQEGECMA
jgi:sulfite reductase (NADPH) hemoprotein beta-component